MSAEISLPEACCSCRFWRGLDGMDGICRRYAPRSWVVGLNPVLGAKSPLEVGQHPFASWPATEYGDWCGEYSPVPSEPAKEDA